MPVKYDKKKSTFVYKVSILPYYFVHNTTSGDMWKYVDTLLFFQINWASTEFQIEECMMKGREKVRNAVVKFCKTFTIAKCLFGKTVS